MRSRNAAPTILNATDTLYRSNSILATGATTSEDRPVAPVISPDANPFLSGYHRTAVVMLGLYARPDPTAAMIPNTR